MVHYIELGGQQRPLLFGMAALYDYERRTGRKAMADFSGFSTDQVSVSVIVDLTLSGLIVGHRKEKKDIAFEEYDVAEWLTPEAIEKVMTAFVESFPAFEKHDAAKKKKYGRLKQSTLTP